MQGFFRIVFDNGTEGSDLFQVLDSEAEITDEGACKKHIARSNGMFLYKFHTIVSKDKRLVIVIYFLRKGHTLKFVNLPIWRRFEPV